MPNIAAILKAEISRVARKEARAETEGLKRTTAAQRAEIASLKRRVQDLEKQLKAFNKVSALRAAESPGGVVAESDANADGLRFRAEGMASNRKRLNLSAADFGLLVGATDQSVYLWEQGKSKPRAKALAAIAALRGVGKREVARRLEALKQAS